MPKEKIARTGINSSFDAAEEYLSDIKGGELVGNLSIDDLKTIQDLATQSAKALVESITIGIKDFDVLKYQLLNPSSAEQCQDIIQLLHFICIAEVLYEIYDAENAHRVDIISDYLYDMFIELPKEYIDIVNHHIAIKENVFKREEEVEIIKMTFDQRQKYIVDPDSKLIDFAKEIQGIVQAGRNLLDVSSINGLELYSTYINKHAILQTKSTTLEFDSDFSINVEHAQIIFVQFIKKLKEYLRNFSASLPADIRTTTTRLQKNIEQLHSFLHNAIKQNVPVRDILMIAEQVNSILATSLVYSTNTFHPIRSNTDPKELIFNKPKPALNANMLAPALQSILVNLEQLEPWVHNDDEEIIPYRMFINNLIQFTNVTIFCVNKIFTDQREISFANRVFVAKRIFLEYKYLSLAFSQLIGSFSSMLNLMTHLERWDSRLDVKTVSNYLTDLIVDLIKNIVPKLYYPDLNADQLDTIIVQLSSLDNLLHGQQLQTFLKTKLLLEKVYVDRIITPVQIPDPDWIGPEDEQAPIITVDLLQKFITSKTNQYESIIASEGAGDTETFPLEAGVLKDGRTIKDVSIKKNYYQAIITYAADQYSPRVPSQLVQSHLYRLSV